MTNMRLISTEKKQKTLRCVWFAATAFRMIFLTDPMGVLSVTKSKKDNYLLT